MAQLQPSSSAPDFDVKHHIELYLAGDFDQLSADFLGAFQHFAYISSLTFNDGDRTNLLRPLNSFLTLFTQPDYLVPEKYTVPFVQANFLLSNLIAITPLRNSDAFLKLLLYQPANFVKILTLYSARNAIQFDRRKLFDANPALALVWYHQFFKIFWTGLVGDNVIGRLHEHLAYHDERMSLVNEITEPYFGSSYLGGDTDRAVKPLLNETVRRSLQGLRCENRPNPRKIAMFSDTWFPEHSVYRISSAFVKKLKENFHITFFHAAAPREKLDVSIFDEVHQLRWTGSALHLGPLRSNDFMAVYFPDVGITLPSIILANHRIAPIQLTSPGHSVSTWGAEIDYFISGADVETPVAPERNYSERLVLLPGMGAIHNRPLYRPTGRVKAVPKIVINGPWTGHKTNAPFCRTLRKLLDRVRVPVRLRLFPGLVQHMASHLPFVADIRERLGNTASIDIIPNCNYETYMGLMEEGDLSLDSFHFAGCNTVADSLFLRKPTVVWEGGKWYNRIGPSMLRLVGLDEYIATNEEEYLEKALLLIHDDERREAVAMKLRAADLDATIFSTEHAPAFGRALDYLIANHERLKAESSRDPIVIE